MTDVSIERARRNWRRVVMICIASAVGIIVLPFVVFFLFVVATRIAARGGMAKQNATLASLAVIKTTLAEYQLTYRVLPMTLTTLQTTRYLERGSLVDGWNRPLVYGVSAPGSARPYSLFSCGPDGVPNTIDDISVPWP